MNEPTGATSSDKPSSAVPTDNGVFTKQAVGGWLLSIIGVLVVSTLVLGHTVVYRFPDLDKRHEETNKGIKDLRDQMKADMDGLRGDSTALRKDVVEHKEKTDKRVRAVHVLACEAVKKRSDACATTLITASVDRIGTRIAQSASSVKVSLDDQSKPIVAEGAVATALKLEDLSYKTLSEYNTRELVTDDVAIQRTVRVLMSADPGNFETKDGVITFRVNNGSATIWPSSPSRVNLLAARLSNTASLLKVYGVAINPKAVEDKIASSKADLAFGQLQKLSAQERASDVEQVLY